MNLRQIEVFRTIMRTGSIKGAAGLLRVSQPAVSQVLLHLEDQLTYALFMRVQGRLQATPQAKLLYSEIETVYEGVQRVTSLAEGLKGPSQGELRILASPGTRHTIIPQTVRRFRSSNPGVRIFLDLLSYEPMVQKLKTQQADVAVAICPSDEPSLITSPLCRCPLLCLLPAGHPLLKFETLGPADLRGHPLVALGDQSAVGRMVLEAFTEAGESPTIVITVPFGMNAHSLVLAGIGAAVIDGFTAAAGTAAGLEIRPFNCSRALDVVVLHNPVRPPTRDTQSFVDALKCVASETCPPLS